MEYRITAGVPVEEIAKYFAWFYPSLQQYADKYLPLIFTDPANAPDHHAYLCPMCLNNGIVLLEKVDLKLSSIFSQDHFPPKSVGGFHTMLVCKDCNSNAGGAFDFILKEQLSKMSLENKVPQSQVKAVTTITGVPGNYKGSFSINETGEAVLGFNAEGKTSAVYLNQWINTPAKFWEATIVLPNPDEGKVAKALVRAAYLYCFGAWGYEFAFSRSAEMIRKYLAGECQYPVRLPIAWLGAELTSKNPVSIPAGLCHLQEPVEARCFLVNIALKNLETGFQEIAVIPIPNSTNLGWEDLGRLGDTFNKLIINKTLVTIGHANKYTLQVDSLDGYAKSWEYLYKS